MCKYQRWLNCVKIWKNKKHFKLIKQDKNVFYYKFN